MTIMQRLYHMKLRAVFAICSGVLQRIQSRGHAMRPCSGQQRGAVLVLVLWVLAVLSLVVGFYASEVKVRRNLGSQAMESLRTREEIKALLCILATRLATPDMKPEDVWEKGLFVPDGLPHRIVLNETAIDFILEDERGKIDLNKAPDEDILLVLREMLRLQGENPALADRLLNAILDWKDSDNLPRDGGAEDEIYEQKRPAYVAANGPFKSIEELLLVEGMTYELFYGRSVMREGAGALGLEEAAAINPLGLGLMHIFTVYNDSGKVIKDYAPELLLNLIADRIEMQNASVAHGQTGPINQPGQIGRSVSGGVLRCYIRIGNMNYEVYWKPGVSQPVFDQPSDGLPFKILRWIELAQPHPWLLELKI